MYRIGHQIKHHYRIYIIISLVAIGVLIATILVLRHDLKSQTVLRQSSAVTQYYSANSTATQQINEHGFSFALPDGWKPAININDPYEIYSWQGTSGDAARRIDVYINKVPTNLAVNALLPVQVNGNQLEATGSVSENCTDFTTPTPQSAVTGTVTAKWDGVNFICDTANYERDVVAIGSAQGAITLDGPNTGQHAILLVYTDNSGSADYTIFESIVESFHLL